MENLEERYFQWLVNKVHGNEQGRSYISLLRCLYARRFDYYILPIDGNRSEDGIDLRYSGFGYECDVDQHEVERYLDHRDCSVLEMMVALAIRMEYIVGDSTIGDRTGLWFWKMIDSLGLLVMHDEDYDEDYVIFRLDRFMNHDYAPNGKGGLFTLENPPHDLRDAEIWKQMCWFLSEAE